MKKLTPITTRVAKLKGWPYEPGLTEAEMKEQDIVEIIARVKDFRYRYGDREAGHLLIDMFEDITRRDEK